MATRAMIRKLNHALASLVLMYSATARSQEIHTTMATIEGKDGYTMSGNTWCGRGEATSTIKPGERFIARELSDGEKDWEVYLKSGISGTIPRDRIRLLPDEPLARLNFASCKKEWRKLQSKRIKKSADDDVAYSAKKYHGVANYYKTLVQASEGDAKAFGQLSSLDMDGVAGEGNEWNTTWALLPSCSPGSLPSFGKDTRHFFPANLSHQFQTRSRTLNGISRRRIKYFSE